MRTGDVLRLQWDQLDLERSLLRLEPETTKNNQGRLVPLVKEVTEALWKWKQRTLHRYPPCPWVCHYRGNRLLNIQTKSWRKACQRVGVNGKIFPALRRTAIRNMMRAEISERVAMSISEHKSRSVLDLYDIVSETDLVRACAQPENRDCGDSGNLPEQDEFQLRKEPEFQQNSRPDARTGFSFLPIDSLTV